MSDSTERPGGLRQALEAALLADPDDVATHAAYADLLMEEGDPRGEFIQVQFALEDESRPGEERKRLRQREQELLQAHQHQWLGELAPILLNENRDDAIRSEWGRGRLGEIRFRRGWPHHLHISYLSLRLARALRRAPQLRLLRELVIETVQAWDTAEMVQPEDHVPQNEHSIGLCPLVGSPFLANVRRLRLGEDQGDDYRAYNCWFHSTVVVDLLRGMPRLEELYLFANDFDLNELFALPTLSHLRVLQVYHGIQVHRLQILAENPAFQNLTHLLIHPHHVAESRFADADDEAGYLPHEGYLPLSVVRPLLHSPNLPNLQHLRLRVSSMGDAGCEEIVRSGILRRLKTLDLRHGRITDEGARILAECPDTGGRQTIT
jgi:uncharacterized protein (TIGR02996 family)